RRVWFRPRRPSRTASASLLRRRVQRVLDDRTKLLEGDQPLDPPPVDEQGRRGEDAERHGLVHVRLDVGTEPSLLHAPGEGRAVETEGARDRKSTRLNSSHGSISYA